MRTTEKTILVLTRHLEQSRGSGRGITGITGITSGLQNNKGAPRTGISKF